MTTHEQTMQSRSDDDVMMRRPLHSGCESRGVRLVPGRAPTPAELIAVQRSAGNAAARQLVRMGARNVNVGPLATRPAPQLLEVQRRFQFNPRPREGAG